VSIKKQINGQGSAVKTQEGTVVSINNFNLYKNKYAYSSNAKVSIESEQTLQTVLVFELENDFRRQNFFK
jgi:hypothetical protein